MATVTLKNLKKVYPHIGIYNKNRKGSSNLQITEEGVVAVQSFSMEIKDKEFIVLVGPSGCGKSTTLRMIAGLENITEGELMIDGVRVNDVMPKNRDIAMVFQNYALYPHMTVYRNLAFALELRKWSKEDIDRKVQETAEILDITDCLNRKPKQLSGGQKQRVAIGRAIVRNPKVFLMDEPLSNLDAKLRTQMRAELIKLRRRVDTTFVYVTHDQTEAMTLGDRIVIMSDGYIKQIGTPQEVFDHPDNLFVAGFIGSPQMNFIDADLHYSAGSYEVLIAGKSVHVGGTISDALKQHDIDSQHITLGIRPEHITVSRHGDLSGIVEVSEMMGSSVHLHVNCGEYNVVIVAPVVDLPPQNRTGFEPGTEIRFYMNMNFIHLFGEDGNNLI